MVLNVNVGRAAYDPVFTPWEGLNNSTGENRFAGAKVAIKQDHITGRQRFG